MATNKLTATVRDKIGKANRQLADDGQVPAVLYGPGRESVAIALDRHDLELFLGHHAEGATFVELELEGEKKPIMAMIRDVQHSAVKGTVLHVDFMEVSMTKAIHADIALHLVNDPAGVRAGGVLNVALHSLSVEAAPNDLPESIDVDVAALEMGDSLHARDVALPKGVTLLTDEDAIVASVQAPRVEEEIAPEIEEGAEPEIIGAKGESEE